MSKIVISVMLCLAAVCNITAQDTLWIKSGDLYTRPEAYPIAGLDSVVYFNKYMYLYGSQFEKGRIGMRYEKALGPDRDGGFFFKEPISYIYGGTKYDVAKMTIDTENGAEIDGKTKADYRKCNIHIDSRNDSWNYSGTGKIRGRGNSSWAWYPKKPYRLKLDKKAEILGLGKNKDWVLLANYRDPTDLMNTFVFNWGEAVGLPCTNHTRYVEITLNGEYIGLYQLTEQVEVAKTRVNIDDERGILLELDVDDGPGDSPEATDNFWTEVYRMPACVKNPDDPSADVVDSVKQEFARLEYAIWEHDYDEFEELADVNSFIDYLLVQEFVYNVEVAAPRSIYLHKDVGGKWTFGPLWDFDAGYDFDWNDMYYGHGYFDDYDKTVLGTDPARHVSNYSYTPSFFTDMWKSSRFVAKVRERWQAVKPRIVSEIWHETLKYYDAGYDAMGRDDWCWWIDKEYSSEVLRMQEWITNRVEFIDATVNAYPEGR